MLKQALLSIALAAGASPALANPADTPCDGNYIVVLAKFNAQLDAMGVCNVRMSMGDFPESCRKSRVDDIKNAMSCGVEKARDDIRSGTSQEAASADLAQQWQRAMGIVAEYAAHLETRAEMHK